jgi:hypothetical protein
VVVAVSDDVTAEDDVGTLEVVLDSTADEEAWADVVVAEAEGSTVVPPLDGSSTLAELDMLRVYAMEEESDEDRCLE